MFNKKTEIAEQVYKGLQSSKNTNQADTNCISYGCKFKLLWAVSLNNPKKGLTGNNKKNYYTVWEAFRLDRKIAYCTTPGFLWKNLNSFGSIVKNNISNVLIKNPIRGRYKQVNTLELKAISQGTKNIFWKVFSTFLSNKIVSKKKLCLLNSASDDDSYIQ